MYMVSAMRQFSCLSSIVFNHLSTLDSFPKKLLMIHCIFTKPCIQICTGESTCNSIEPKFFDLDLTCFDLVFSSFSSFNLPLFDDLLFYVENIPCRMIHRTEAFWNEILNGAESL